MSEFIPLESDGVSAESLDSRAEPALTLLERLLEDGELHVRVSDEDDQLIVEMM